MGVITYTNPVYPHYFADPFVWRHDGEYYAVGTGPREAVGLSGAAEQRVFPMLVSRDLAHWEALGGALIRPAPELGDSFWAPEIVRSGATWFLYYSVGFGDARHVLRVATSDDVRGPYRDVCALTDPESCQFAIDPHPFRDDDGRWYLFHARDFLNTCDDSGRDARAGTALVVHELLEMTRLGTSGQTVLRARHDWQRFLENRAMYGAVFDWHTLEGPFVTRHAGRYYCFFSGGRWEAESYGVDYAVADRISGAWSDAGGESGPRVLRSAHGRLVGPGHNSIVVGPDGQTEFVVYHAWDPAMTARRMCIDELSWTQSGPRCRGPTWSVQQLRRDALGQCDG